MEFNPLPEKISQGVDSHAHLDMAEFDPDREQVIARARSLGVRCFLCPAEVTHPRSLSLCQELRQHHSGIFLAAGLHPHQAELFSPEHLALLESLASDGTIVAIGEIGLDRHYLFSPLESQILAFRAQLALAQKMHLPVVIHSRKTGTEIIRLVKEEKFSEGGILHCFTEDWETAREMMERGFFISFSGILTYPSAANLREVAVRIPLDRLLVETDSPYLVPASQRSQLRRNEPAFVLEVAATLAKLKGLSIEPLMDQVCRNFAHLFPASREIFSWNCS